MSSDLRRAFDESFETPVPRVPLAAIRERGIRDRARKSTRWRIVVAAVALTSAFTLTLACERYAPARAPAPIVSSTPAPIVT